MEVSAEEILKSVKLNGEKRFATTLKALLATFFAAFTLFVTVFTFQHVFENSAWKYLILTVFVAALLYTVLSVIKLPVRYFAMLLFALSLLLNILLIWQTDTKPVSDFALFYDSAVKLARGDLSWNQSMYFQTWSYQSGVVCLYAAVIKIFGASVLNLQIFNAIFIAGTKALVYLIAREIASERSARFVSLLYLTYAAPYFIATTLSNQQFATCLFYLGIYAYIRAHKSAENSAKIQAKQMLWLSCAAGISIALANVVRPMGSIVLLAILAASVLASLCRKDWIYLRSAAVTIATYFILITALSALIVSSGVNSNGLKNLFPNWKFVIGLNQETGGMYSAKDEQLLFGIKDAEQRDAAARELINARLPRDPAAVLTFIKNKTDKMWAEQDYPYWISGAAGDINFVKAENLERFINRAIRLERAYYFLVSIMALFAVDGLFRPGRTQKQALNGHNQFALSLIMALSTLFYLVFVLIEIQVRYRYFPVIATFILAAAGLDRLRGMTSRGINYLKIAAVKRHGV